MKRLAFVVLLVCAGCNRAEQPVGVFPNGCLVASVEYQANLSLQRHGVWSRIVKINFDNQVDGHAVVVFSLMSGALSVYDVNTGSSKLGISQRDLPSIVIALKYQYKHMTTAVWFD